MTSSEHFQQLEALFHELEAATPEARAERLAQIQAENPALHDELLGLLEAPNTLLRDEQALDRMASEGGLAAALDRQQDPERIGPYCLGAKLGEGGMGRVYLAEQREPVRRQVALKLLRHGFDSDEARARFRAERQALAILEHPNIARVLDAGSTDDGRPWFAMEYIDGQPITRWATEQGLDLKARIRLLLPVCDAIQHAHRKGLIHRDLKPSNLLVVDTPEGPQVKVIDFGIARQLDLGEDERSQVTRLGELVGTPEYMSPEQASLGEIDIDTRSDVYALGLVLYELLVGELPHTGAELRKLGIEAMCRTIREADTPRPSRVRSATLDEGTLNWRSRLKGDLDSVLLKALAKDRERRYGSASELADDLRRYLDDEPVLAQPPSLRYRAGKFIRRHRWPVSAAALVALALIAGTIIASHGLIQARLALAESEASLAEAELYGKITNAYADALQRLFGQSEDVQATTEALLAQLEERTADWQNDPENASLASFAIGRHFISRNDYQSAKAAFEPWLQEGYGEDLLKSFGWQLLGFSYRYTGEAELALQAFRQAAALSPPNRANRPGTSSRLVQIALLSGEAEDYEIARTALRNLLASEELEAEGRIGVLNSSFQLEADAGNAEAAYAAMREAVDIIDAYPALPLAGRDTNRINLARLELFQRQDFDAVQSQLDALRSGEHAVKGESRESARVLEIEGVLRRFQGRSDEAVAALEAALPLYERYAGASSSDTLRAWMELLVTRLERGEMELARQALEPIASHARGPEERALLLASAYLALAEGRRGDAETTLANERLGEEARRRFAYLRHHVEFLEQQLAD
ncbi:serine/threonine-protein kinase [Wenzhouxiangella marina]|uniref:Serine/threonine protein kinase with TPR repeats n=1 Tax=Wenzhouxiangella marina TaxID=1579979 RepID=A0A0K0XUL2_9GAMM|nr:serine/threonine-protein kinase [Wenzhouxiangella marina]AKS41312.1 Serine/threonine protein kinase with TPR repeats [Wenzhouxiangella marina]MBB6086938.1 non-specific serine/threonine protein kinase/serine/threonine-protein kinase [Wenzhouxiangella marina]